MRVERVLFGAVLLAGASLAVDASLTTATPSEVVAVAPAASSPTSVPAAAIAAADPDCYDYAGNVIPCPTVAPTTAPPTTAPPTTMMPTTMMPTTMAPTMAPTVAPTTAPPTTEAPTTTAVLDDDHVRYIVRWVGNDNLDIVATVAGVEYTPYVDVVPPVCEAGSDEVFTESVLVPRGTDPVEIEVYLTDDCQRDTGMYIDRQLVGSAPVEIRQAYFVESAEGRIFFQSIPNIS